MTEDRDPAPDCPEEFFKRDFPLLEGKLLIMEEGDKVDMTKVTNAEMTYVIYREDVQKNCKDNQKIIDVIDNIEMNDERLKAGWDKCLCILKKELGLDKE